MLGGDSNLEAPPSSTEDECKRQTTGGGNNISSVYLRTMVQDTNVIHWYRIVLKHPKSNPNPELSTKETHPELSPIPLFSETTGSMFSAVVGYKSFIYVLGGEDNDECPTEFLNTVSYLDTTDPERVWKCAANMRKRRWKPLAVVLKDKIYVIGGDCLEDDDELTWAECFDISQNAWEYLPPVKVMVGGKMEAEKSLYDVIIKPGEHSTGEPEEASNFAIAAVGPEQIIIATYNFIRRLYVYDVTANSVEEIYPEVCEPGVAGYHRHVYHSGKLEHPALFGDYQFFCTYPGFLNGYRFDRPSKSMIHMSGTELFPLDLSDYFFFPRSDCSASSIDRKLVYGMFITAIMPKDKKPWDDCTHWKVETGCCEISLKSPDSFCPSIKFSSVDYIPVDEDVFGALVLDDGEIEGRSDEIFNEEIPDAALLRAREFLTRIRLDTACCFDTLINLTNHVTQVETKNSEIEAFISSDDQEHMLNEKVWEFDHLSRILDSEVNELENSICLLQAEIGDIREESISFSCEMEAELHDSEELLSLALGQVSDIKKKSSNFQRILFSFGGEKTRKDNMDVELAEIGGSSDLNSMIKMQAAEQLKDSKNITERVCSLEKQMIEFQRVAASAEASEEKKSKMDDLELNVLKSNSLAEEKCISVMSKSNSDLEEEIRILRGMMDCLKAYLHQSEETNKAVIKEIRMQINSIRDMVMQSTYEENLPSEAGFV